MAITHVASGQGYAQGSSTNFGGNMTANSGSNLSTKTFTYTPTGSGNVVLFWVTMIPIGTSPTTCSLSATGWTFTQIGGIVNGGTSAGCAAMFSATAPNTSAATITMTWNQNNNGWFSNLIGEFSGVDTTTPTAGSNSATGTGLPTASVTPTTNDCMIWVPCNDSVTAVGLIGSGMATKGVDDTQQDWSEYRLLSGQSGVSQSCTVTGSGAYLVAAVAIQSARVTATAGSVPSGTALTAPAFTAKFLYFDTGDYGIGV